MVKIQHSDLMTKFTKDETQLYISAGFTPPENHSHPQSVLDIHGQAGELKNEHAASPSFSNRMLLPYNVEGSYWYNSVTNPGSHPS